MGYNYPQSNKGVISIYLILQLTLLFQLMTVSACSSMNLKFSHLNSVFSISNSSGGPLAPVDIQVPIFSPPAFSGKLKFQPALF